MTSFLIINKPFTPLIPDLAVLIGLNESIILQQVHYWISNEFNKNLFEDRNWVYNTYAQWQNQFPYWGKRTIQGTILSLEKKGILLSYEGEGRLKHYSIDYEVLNHLLEDNGYSRICATIAQNLRDHRAKSARSYIDTENTQRIPLEKDARASEPCEPVEDPTSGFCKTAPLKEEKIPKGKKGTRLQDDWTLPDKWRDWSIQCGMMNEEIDMIELKFRNYWLSTTKNPTKKDWFLTWQNWCVREYERKGISLKVKNTVLAEKQAPPKNIPIEQSADPRIQKWNELQPMLRDKVNTYANGAYESWLAPSTRNIKLISANGKAIFEVKNPWYAEKIKLQYREDLVDVLRMIDPKLGVEQNIEFVVQSE